MRMQTPRTTLSRLLLPRELRFVSRGAALVLVGGALFGGFWLSPWSPMGLDRAATLAASGETDRAVAAYMEIADGPGFPATRLDARWQAAWLASVDPTDPQRAVDLLRDFAQREPDTLRTAHAHERLGTLYRLYLGDLVRAAEAWQQAAALAPAAPEAGHWQLDAGLAYLDAGLPDKAAEPLLAATQTAEAVPAHLALGRMFLAEQPTLAYEHYSAAVRLATDEADRSLARLGAATALESLDQVDEALAELEAGGDDDRVLQRRRARLEAREQR